MWTPLLASSSSLGRPIDAPRVFLTRNTCSKPDGVCQILFYIIAFGMGLNISNIYRVIHDGSAGSVEQYVQERGRGGRDGCLCEVMLYLYHGSTRGKINLEMKGYCKNAKQCRRN